MRRTRTPQLTAGHAPPAQQRVAVDQPAAGALATIMMVLATLACPTSTPIQPEAGPPVQAVVGGSLAGLQPAVLPMGDLDGGVVTADRPNSAPTAVHALLLSALTASGHRRRRGRPPLSRPARRPIHHAAGGPRAPPVAPRPSWTSVPGGRVGTPGSERTPGRRAPWAPSTQGVWHECTAGQPRDRA